ncbi:MAG: hypothetical protein WB511_07850 [Nitrososphaeraceae archaeon]
MEQLTKPETINGELGVNVRLTNQNTKNIHEALLFYLRSKTQTGESTYQEIKALREVVLRLRRVLNPS